MSDLQNNLDSLVAASGQLAASTASIKAQKDINQLNIDEARRILMMQREWALSDWDMVNRYNSPAQQMQRYLEAGLNPNLIYGNAANSPSAMVRNTTQGAARADAAGITDGLKMYGDMTTNYVNQRMAYQQLQNDTNLKQAQILNLKSQSDRTNQQVNLTNEQFEDLVKRAAMVNTGINIDQSLKLAQMDKTYAEKEKVEADTQRTIALLKLAQQQGKLNQYDIDMIERLGNVPGSNKLLQDILKMIVQGFIK